MPSLDELRREIDRIDDSLHDLLMDRARIVEQIRESKMNTAPDIPNVPFLRPGREAQVIRRLIARHSGVFPKAVVARLWREIMSTFTALQGSFILAVYVPDGGDRDLVELSREHYGTYTKIVIHRSESQVIRAVMDGEASVAILPVPSESSATPWWISLMGGQSNPLYVISRLPFISHQRLTAEAVTVARLPPEATGDDKSWLGLETLHDVSRSRLIADIAAAGFADVRLLDSRPSSAIMLTLVEVSGCVTATDPRLAALVQTSQPVLRAVALGGYATPLPLSALSSSSSPSQLQGL